MIAETDIAALSVPEQIWLWLRVNMVEIAGAFAVLVIGLLIASFVSRWVERTLTKSPRFDQTIAAFLSNLVKYALWALVLVTVLSQFGVETTSILAALGGLALAVGLALQGTLSNVASGVMILVQKPFKVGEAISVNEFTAVVQQIGLFTTELKQFDGLFVMVPNSELWNQPIVNLHRHPTRRFELIVGIGYDDSMEQARKELLALAEADERVLDDPAPQAFVNSLDDSSVGIGLRVWCATGDYMAVSWDLTEKAKARFDAVGLNIPFPQREVTMKAA
ncbi:mechanosensitive ion channel domain-containing protein [Qipengyuania sp. JC766]|uniref:mechanosensitive ion channel family protein n=1 Tax=Qipengyuania sp. JC766 TaxID=3232139 RepID=UPI00345817AA